MADPRSIRTEYAALASDHVKFSLLRTAIMFTVVLTLFSAVNQMTSADIQGKIERVWELKEVTEKDPKTGDKLIDVLYFSDGSEEAYRDKRQSRRYVDSVTAKKDPVLLRKEQDSLMKVINAAASKPFEVKLSFIADTNIDLRYWIFILPFMLMASFVYTLMLDAKLKRLEIAANSRSAENNPDDPFSFLNTDSLTSYSTQPYKFTRNFLGLVDVILVFIFIYTLIRFFGEINPEIALLVCFLYFLCLYFFTGYAINKYLRIVNYRWPSKPTSSPFVINLWYFLQRAAGMIIHVMPTRSRSILGSSAVIGTLFMVMSIRTCNCGEEKKDTVAVAAPITEPIDTITSVAPITEPVDTVRIAPIEKVAADSSIQLTASQKSSTEVKENKHEEKKDELKGYELITGYKDNVWQFEEGGGRFVSRIYQWFYILSLVVAVFFLCVQFFKQRLFFASRKGKTILNWSLIITLYLFLFFTIYFAFAPLIVLLLLPVFLLSLVLIAVFSTRYKKYIFTSTEPNAPILLQRAIFTASLPFFLMAIFNLFYYLKDVKGWPVLYAGLLLLLAGAFGIKEKIVSR